MRGATWVPVAFMAAASCGWPITAGAQAVAIPREASFGVAVLADRAPSQSSSAVVGSLGWDEDPRAWASLIVEGEIGATSEAAPCRAPGGELRETCWDAAVMAGVRVRRVPHSVSGLRPFAHVLLGEYWKGSGLEDGDPEYVSSHFAVQLGGGVEIRWPGSFQGVRLSVDVRHVFADDHDRSQLRLLAAYVIGPRRFAPRPSP